MLAFPKPKDMPKLPPKAVIEYPDGREVCNMQSAAGRAEYERRKDVMHRRQNSRCILCGKHLERVRASFEHEDGKGMGGSHQDDRIWKLDPVTGELKPYNGVAHTWCNGEKGSKRGGYVQMGMSAFRAGVRPKSTHRAAGTSPYGVKKGNHRWMKNQSGSRSANSATR